MRASRRRISHRTAIVRRKSDGKLFRPSHPGHPAFPGFWFIEVEQRGRFWVDTQSEPWAFHDGGLFDVIIKHKGAAS